MRKLPRIGLLPLYIKLYDEIRPGYRDDFRPFLDDIADRFRREKVDVTAAPICTVDAEFREAIARFEREAVDVIVTVHLAYSPSEEALPALCRTRLPLLMLDTTMDEAFGYDVNPARLMANHGIHGVQDLASVCRRAKRPFEIVAGHLAKSTVIQRAADLARATVAANEFLGSRALRLGHAFHGMGDFAVSPDVLASRFGIDVEYAGVERIGEFADQVTAADVEVEMTGDREIFQAELPEEVHRRSVRVGLALRRCLEACRADAFSVNFQAFVSDQPPVDTVPFLEASKAMARGVGYAGEGDLLTACLVGALCRGFGMTTFTEMFCPDWRGGSVFISHMGEINPEVIPGNPLLLEKEYPFSAAQNPAFIAGSPGPGKAVLVNLSPGPDASFRLILAPVDVLPDESGPELRSMVRGWLRPALPLDAFLEQYSRLGGTHHCALVMGNRTEALQAMARQLGIDCAIAGA